MSKQPQSKIKDIYIELNGYEFHHSPYERNDDASRMIGRDKVKSRIISLLKNTSKKSGTYLVTGFRGMGKTSIVRQAIDEVNGVKDKVTWVTLLKIAITWFLIFLVFQLVLYFLNLKFSSLFNFFGNTFKINSFLVFTLGILLFLEIILFCLYFLYKNNENNLKIKIIKVVYRKAKDIRGFFLRSAKIIFFLLIIMFPFTVVFVLNTVRECNVIEVALLFFKGNLIDYRFSLKVLKELLPNFIIYSSLMIFLLVISTVLFDILFHLVSKLEKRDKWIKFEINLSQDSLSERDILKRITEKLISYWESNYVFLMGGIISRRFYLPFNFLFKLIGYKRSDDRSTNEKILDRLYGLRNRLAGVVNITRDSDGNPNVLAEFQQGISKIILPFESKKDKNSIDYPRASAKEAEDELLSIFDMIHASDGSLNGSLSDFIFIIDELDKIEPISTSLMDALGDILSDLDGNYANAKHIKNRQEAVAHLLANMKGFLNVVKAKFFFIGGRELFDADMADIADRDSFYSSVFNDVIYVNSFYKDSLYGGKKESITVMTEAFVFNSILGKTNYHADLDKRNALSLDSFIKACKIDDNIDNFNVINSIVNYNICDKPNTVAIVRPELIYLASVLQNFIIFLTYRSNGSPKKLTSLFEHYVTTDKKLESDYDLNLYVLGKNKNANQINDKLYLNISYSQQYEMNLTADLVRPYLMYHSRYLKSLGDKLLFSTTFIYDHLLKFYPFGFSWRNIELIPEVILANKEPHLRDHIRSILGFMGNYLVKDCISGLFDYKFHSVIRKELGIVTKTSDLASAAFNFTLDESLQVKHHYIRKLRELQKKYHSYTPIEGDNQFVHALHFLQVILGNLYFYDKEYDEAILYYTEAIQTLRLPSEIDKRKITRHQYYLWLTTKLRLGLTLEKLEAFESANSIYKSIIIDSQRYLQYIDDRSSSRSSLETPHSEVHRTMETMILPYIALLGSKEKNRVDGVTYNNLLSTIKDLRSVIDPPHLGRLEDIDCTRRSFLWADFYSNVGSILYYKNAQMSKFYTRDVSGDSFLIDDDDSQNSNYVNTYFLDKLRLSNTDCLQHNMKIHKCWRCTFFNALHNHQKKGNNVKKFDFQPSLTSLVFYMNGLKHLTDEYLPLIRERVESIPDELNPLQVSVLLLHSDFADLANSKKMYYIANTISKIGDAIYASLNINPSELDYNLFIYEMILDAIDKKSIDDNFVNDLVDSTKFDSDLISFNSVFKLYMFSSVYFKFAGQAYYCSFCLKKLLYLVKDQVRTRANNIIYPLNTIYLIEKITMQIAMANTWQNEIANKPTITKYRDILNLQNEKYNKPTNQLLFRNVNNASDVREAVIVTENIKLRLNRRSNFVLSNYDRANSKYIRMLEMKFRAEQIYIEHYETSVSISINSIIEALFCIRECIIIIQLYDPGYIIGYSFLAASHEWAVSWSAKFRKYLQENEAEREDLIKMAENVLGKNSMLFIDPNYHREAAIQNYHNVIQMHSEGRAYKDKVLGLYALEDDYNDLLTHFQIAMERYCVNTGEIRSKIDKLQKEVNKSKLYEYENYG